LKNEKSVSLSFYWTITSGMVGRNVYRLICSNLPSPVHPWCMGVRIYDFYRLSDGKGVVERRIS